MHPSEWRIGSCKDNMICPSVSQDGVLILDAEYTGMSTNPSSPPKSLWVMALQGIPLAKVPNEYLQLV